MQESVSGALSSGVPADRRLPYLHVYTGSQFVTDCRAASDCRAACCVFSVVPILMADCCQVGSVQSIYQRTLTAVFVSF